MGSYSQATFHASVKVAHCSGVLGFWRTKVRKLVLMRAFAGSIPDLTSGSSNGRRLLREGCRRSRCPANRAVRAVSRSSVRLQYRGLFFYSNTTSTRARSFFTSKFCYFIRFAFPEIRGVCPLVVRSCRRVFWGWFLLTSFAWLGVVGCIVFVLVGWLILWFRHWKPPAYNIESTKAKITLPLAQKAATHNVWIAWFATLAFWSRNISSSWRASI